MNTSSLCAGLFCLLLIGCGGGGIASVKPEVDVEIVNMSSVELRNARVRFGEHQCEWGWVVISATKGFGFFPHSITDEAELHWDEDDSHRVKNIDLKPVYSEGKSGRLTFVVYDERVEVAFTEKR